QQTDTYYIVAHFHYVLFGGSIFGLFAGMYYWWPKVTGRLLNERIGKWHFWLMLIGFNVTFAPFHWLGLEGMPRRIYTYPSYAGWNLWNFVSTVGAYTIALSIAVFLFNVVRCWRKPQFATDDPWDGRTIEWTTPSPPPPYNFAEIPVVHSVDDFWHRKYAEGEDGRLAPVVAGASNGYADGPLEQDGASDPPYAGTGPGEARPGHGHGEGHGIHMPSPSYFPLVSALGLPILSYGILYSPILVIDGVLLLLAGLFGWALEPSAEPEPATEEPIEPGAEG
ncbi:MAG TPA: cbb3-type cytochrome c oxidase subunit I, partial [Actinomycetota bacterium]